MSFLSPVPIGLVGGDLSSNLPNPTVIAIQNQPVDPRIPNNGYTLVYNGGEWIPTPAPTNTATIFQGIWDASTNTPDIENFPGLSDGFIWLTNVAGNTNLGGITDWKIGDYAIYSSGQWYQLSNSSFGWGLTGNAGTNPATNYIGTSDVHDLSIRADAQEIIRVLVGGGINVTGNATITGDVVLTNGQKLVIKDGSSFYTALKAGVQSANITYTLPATSGVAGATLVTDGSDNLSWKAPISILAGSGLTGGGDLSTNRTISMPNVGTAATYGSASQVPVFTTDTQGRVSAVTNTSIAISGSQITSGVVSVTNGGTGLGTTPANGQLLIGNGTGFTETTLTAGTGISVTNGAGSITLANTGVLSVGATAPIASSGGATPTVSINDSGVVAASYGSASSVATFTVTAKGLITTAATTPIAIVASQVTSGTFPAGVAVQNIFQNVTAAISGGSGNLVLGEVVYLKNSGGSATNPAVDRAVATSSATAGNNTIGLISTVAGIANNNTGSIITKSVLSGLNTNAYTQGDILYVDPVTPGALTNVKPVYPNIAIPVGIVVVRNASQGAIYVDHSVGVDNTTAVKVPSLASVTTIAGNSTTTLSATLIGGAVYLPLDVSGSNATLTTPIDALTTSDYGRLLYVHNTSNNRTITFNAGGTTFLQGGVNLVLGTKSMVTFIWSPVGGGAGRWVQMTAPVNIF